MSIDLGKTEWEKISSKWRISFVVQVAVTVIALYFCFTNFFRQQLKLHVPDRLIDGRYPISQVPDSEIKEFAYDFVSLNANYNPFTAGENFTEGRRFLKGAAIEKFDREVVEQELRAIRDTERSQMMEIDPARTRISRDEPGRVKVTVVGPRSKVVKQSTLPTATLRYKLTVEVEKGEAKHRLGLVVSDYVIEVLEGR